MTQRQTASALTRNPDAVWERWTRPERWVEHNPELASAQLEGPLAVGSRIAIRPKAGPASASFVTALVPRARFTTEGRLPLCRLTIDHALEPEGEAWRFTHTLSLEGPLSGLFWALFARKLAAQLPGMVERLARLAEADRPA